MHLDDYSDMSFEDSMKIAKQFCDPPISYWDELRGRLIDSLKTLKDDQRLDFLRSLPFCKECGCYDPKRICQCWNDE